MNKSVIIIGAGGHGKVIADIVLNSGDFVIGFLDDGCNENSSVCGFPVLGGISDYTQYKENCMFVVAIGNSKIREKVVSELTDVNWYTAIHPTAVISKVGTSIGYGTVIMANAVVNPGASIGNHCIINTSSVVEHDNVIEDYVHISVGAKIAGTVRIGKRTWVGIGATVKNNISICNDCMIGAGGVVVKDILMPGTYIGVPVKNGVIDENTNFSK